ncbi:2-amino-4-hydroxy-6-hydroxymethyldihydropteridine diphosphokinase [Mycobacterium spongiae]|uniref:2-amino-4-hydroxy-6-hydroxymethyldihydropteridine diphosphokinase n=1 Tax=Mycobacterium spongiae TaxID=886343 RepID=A0A975K0M4_9MYCO|nr:2-amino-4-hydroxy-6-hydroxymethyldihydropteridine diphosphokinase [Mycobacterium spongiae]QUR69181.1 2-amino-4-hydroxy-6-hydroxymethyldihydropteridine diphosphokinase [Mycobacterium spongiae]
MTQVVLSIGSNVGDRLARLQSVVDGLRDVLVAVSPIYETAPWGGVEQGPFLNAVLIADDPARDGRAWLRRAQAFERAAGRVRGARWGPRSLDVDLITCKRGPRLGEPAAGPVEMIVREPNLTLPHPLAHLRAFVMIPWLAVDPAAELTVGGCPQSVAQLLAEVDPSDRESVRASELRLRLNGRPTSNPRPEE